MGDNIILVQGDITQTSADAIVNAANSSLMGGGGVDGAIHRAGGPAILAECKEVVARQGRLPTGQAVATTAGNLPAKYVIHTVGPVWSGGDHGEDDLLAAAYRNSLVEAAAKSCATVAFPSISTGVYRFPVERAAAVALRTVRDWLAQQETVRQVKFVLFDEATLATYRRAAEAVLS